MFFQLDPYQGSIFLASSHLCPCVLCPTTKLITLSQCISATCRRKHHPYWPIVPQVCHRGPWWRTLNILWVQDPGDSCLQANGMVILSKSISFPPYEVPASPDLFVRHLYLLMGVNFPETFSEKWGQYGIFPHICNVQ